MTDRVDVAPLREAFERSGMTASQVARELEWMRVVPDASRLKRKLGIYTYFTKGSRQRTAQIDRHMALKLAHVLNVDPVDVGL